jgi:hypothetical protein
MGLGATRMIRDTPWALLAPGYKVIFVGDGTTAILRAEASGHAVWVTADQLLGRAPSRVVGRLRDQMQSTSVPGVPRAAL